MRGVAVREHVDHGAPEGVESVFAPSELDKMLAGFRFRCDNLRRYLSHQLLRFVVDKRRGY